MTVGHIYYHIRFHTRYFNYINRKALKLYQAASQSPSPYTQNAVSELKEEGIYTDDIKNLCQDQNMLAQLIDDANALLNQHSQDPIQENQLRPAKIRGIGRNIKNACLPESFVKFFLSDEVLDIVNSYNGMFSRLNYVDTWRSVSAASDDLFYDTEIWHRDHEEMKIIKVFMYLSNVDEATGPFTFIKGTHLQGKMGHTHPANPPLGVLFDEQQIAEFTKPENPEQSSVIICTGKSGTVIFSDTTGIHKGGRTSSALRTVLVAFYASEAGVDQHTYRLPENIDPNTLSPATKYALHL
ncbi:phytanoyl-CoA dioxygenase family protein [Methylotuvimicrobium sp. KM1]|uniref:phytanoyl-CoA dioxygenase family protein n=1 Tax=Methylotuvimicrobium sp. KM1 TaxID=3377707 RepID=UPI00384CE0E1